MQQCRGITEQKSGKGWMEEQGEGRGLMGLSGRRDPGKGEASEM